MADVRRVLVGQDFVCPLPTRFYIDPGNICNLRCEFCPTGQGMWRSSQGLMSLEAFQQIFNKIKPVAREIMLYNYGEPFLNQQLLLMIRLVAASGISTSVHSNLSFAEISESVAEAIVLSGLTELVAAIDGTTQQSYGAYRVGGDFERAVRNLKLLQETRIRLRAITFRLKWRFLVNAYNEAEIKAARRMARAIGVPIQFDLMECWGKESWISSIHRSSWKQRVLRFAGMFSRVKYGEVMGAVGRRFNHDRQKQSSLVLSSRLPWHCSQPFNLMTINWDGTVFPCCTVIDDNLSMGNLLTMELEEVWNNNLFRSCREYLNNYDQGVAAGSVCELGLCGVRRAY